MKIFLALILTSSAVSVHSELETRSEISDPDMLKAMRDAIDSNLSNAMSKSTDDMSASGHHIAALMLASEAGVRAAVVDLRALFGSTRSPRQGSVEEASDDLHLASQMLAQKAKSFRRRAKAMSLKLPKADAKSLITKRAGYPSKDRARDLRKARMMLKKAVKKTGAVELSEIQADLTASASSFLGELRNAVKLLTHIQKKIRKQRKTRPELSVAIKRIDAYVKRSSRDADDLATESQLLETSLLMIQHDEEAFDQGF